MRRVILLACSAFALLLTSNGILFAQKTAPSAEQIKAARDLMAVTGAENSFRSMLALMGA